MEEIKKDPPISSSKVKEHLLGCAEIEMCEAGDCNCIKSPKQTLSSADDLQRCLYILDGWQHQDVVQKQQCNTLSEELRQSELERNRLLEKNRELEITVDLHEESINAIHKNLSIMAKLEENSKNLQSEVAKKDLEITIMREDLRKAEQDLTEKLGKAEKTKHAALSDLEKRLRAQIDGQAEMMTETLQEKDRELEELREQIIHLQQQKTAEVTKLTMEFESKMAKLQRQKTLNAVTQQQSVSNQEIFRRKLQHMKQEFDREKASYEVDIKSLREKILHLENKLGVNTFSKVSVTSATKKPRLNRDQ